MVESGKMNRMKKIASVAVLATSLFACQGLLRAQSAPQDQTEQTQAATTKGVKVSGLDISLTNLGKDNTSTTLSETYLDFGHNRSLWIVGGQTYDSNLFSNSADFGLKYVDGKNLFRITMRDDKNLSGNFDISYGFDTETYINKAFTLLGDVSNFRIDGRRYVDFGVGPQIKFGTENSIFFIYGDRQNTNNYRIGYLFDGPTRLLSFFVDYKDGSTPIYTGFLSFVKYGRTFASYNPNTKTLFSGSLFTFGNKELPDYAMRGLLKEQYILSNRSVVDSDNTAIPPSSLFVSPKDRHADVLRVHFSSDFKTGRFTGALIDNAFMIGTSGGSGYIFTQNLTRNTSAIRPMPVNTYCGAGFGYRFGHLANLTPTVEIQSKGFTINLSASF